MRFEISAAIFLYQINTVSRKSGAGPLRGNIHRMDHYSTVRCGKLKLLFLHLMLSTCVCDHPPHCSLCHLCLWAFCCEERLKKNRHTSNHVENLVKEMPLYGTRSSSRWVLVHCIRKLKRWDCTLYLACIAQFTIFCKLTNFQKLSFCHNMSDVIVF